MDSRATVFVGVMIGLVLIAALAFAVLMVARRVRPPGSETADRRGRTDAPPPLAIILAIAGLLAVAAVLVWQLPEIMGQRAAGPGWTWESRETGFLIAMLVLAVVALIAFVVIMFVRLDRAPRNTVASQEPVPGENAEIATPSGARLLGLFGLAVAILLLCWIYLPADRQYALMLHLVYPATFAVALVLLFDKATRNWSGKPASDSVREWLLCDLFIFVLVLGYLNLEGYAEPDKYQSALWDILHVALFFAVFWMVDRNRTRLRFLVGYAYLIALPVLLLVWRATQGGPAASDGGSWWETIWPFFFVAIIFFALEVVSVVAARNNRSIGTVKDAIFVALYAILLINAIPGEAG
jgi:uncharacterized membrane protein